MSRFVRVITDQQRITFLKIQTTLAVTLVGCIAGGVAQAGSSNKNRSATPIKNFGQMNQYLFRGAQPTVDDYKFLYDAGIRTIIDLRDDPKPYASSAAQTAGLNYVNIPMSDKRRPVDEQIQTFLKAVDNNADGPFYVHCAGGRHRTGVMIAVYRAERDHWSYERAYKEMKDFDYYSRWGHGALGDFVADYLRRLQKQSAVGN